MPFDIKSVPAFKVEETSFGNVEIVLKNGTYVLYNNGIRWMSLSVDDYPEIREMYSSYDLAYGDVLITGLGFGILALWLCDKPNVKSVTVIESSPDVIEIFKKFNRVPENLKIINDNASTFKTDVKYDGIFLDHYELQNWDWRLKDMKEFSSRIKHDVFWAWSLEEAYMLKAFELDKNSLYGSELKHLEFLSIEDKATEWNAFAKKFFPEEDFLLSIAHEKIREYIYEFYKDHYEFYKNYELPGDAQ
jgi:hypothetical protein